jgi:hypothetical protein
LTKLESVKALASYDLIKIKLTNFNKVFGDRIVTDIKPEDLKDYQTQRLKEVKPATVDQELSKARSMVQRAVDNDKVSADV